MGNEAVLVGAVSVGALVDVTIDGVEIVVWRGSSGVLCASDARCPHQWTHLAAAGMVDGNELVCTAHFWRFDARGAGSRIDGQGRREQVTGLAVYAVRETTDGLVHVTLDNP